MTTKTLRKRIDKEKSSVLFLQDEMSIRTLDREKLDGYSFDLVLVQEKLKDMFYQKLWHQLLRVVSLRVRVIFYNDIHDIESLWGRKGEDIVENPDAEPRKRGTLFISSETED